MNHSKQGTLSRRVTAVVTALVIAAAGFLFVLTAQAASALAITKQPENTVVRTGMRAYFSVSATGGSLSYQWQYSSSGTKWSNSSSTAAKTPELNIAGTASNAKLMYRCVISDGTRSVCSNSVRMRINDALPLITKQPVSTVVRSGNRAYFSVVADGTSLSYQWQYSSNGTKWSNSSATAAKTATLGIAGTDANAKLRYRCAITGGGETVYSNTVRMSVNDLLPIILKQPVGAVVHTGMRAYFSVEVDGQSPSYQWQYSSNGTKWSNSSATAAKTATLGIAGTASNAKLMYRCAVTGGGITVYSDTVKMSINDDMPIITAQPTDTMVRTGQRAYFTVAAKGGSLSYQWQYSSNGTKWSNSTASAAKTASLNIAGSSSNAKLYYRCVIKGGGITVYTDPVRLTINDAMPIIRSQPENTIVRSGQRAYFRVRADGSSLAYQWQYSSNGTKWSNSSATAAKTATLGIAGTASNAKLMYRCAVTGGGVTVYSDTVRVNVNDTIPIITKQPVNATVHAGVRAYYTVEADAPSLSYQWQYSANGVSWTDSTASAAKNATFSVAATASNAKVMYRCAITGGGETVYSDSVSLTINDAIPMITSQPQDTVVRTGVRAYFTVAAQGESLTYQWQYSSNGTKWSNSTAAAAKTPSLNIAGSSSNTKLMYRCAITGGGMTVYSDVVRMSINDGMPLILSQPTNIVAPEGKRVSFSVSADGNALTYQWQYSSNGQKWNNSGAATANSPTISITATTSNAALYYRCLVTGGGVSVASDAVSFSINNAVPYITQHPSDVLTTSGQTAYFTVVSQGEDLVYLWQKRLPGADWADFSRGDANGTLKLAVSAEMNGTAFRCVVRNNVGMAVSDAAVLTVNDNLPVIIFHPEDASGCSGSVTELRVSVRGANLRYQWQYSLNGTTWNNSAWATANQSAFSVNVSENNIRYRYRCVVSNGEGSVCSESAVVSINENAPKITIQPENVFVIPDATAVFTIAAEGDGNIFRWQKRVNGGEWEDTYATAGTNNTVAGVALPTDAQSAGVGIPVSASLSVAALQELNGCEFRCVVTNNYGTAVSKAVTLSVDTRNPYITTQPVDVCVPAGIAGAFTVTARGANLTYQWQVSSNNGLSWYNTTMDTATTPSLTIYPTENAVKSLYRCVVSNSYGTAVSDIVRITEQEILRGIQVIDGKEYYFNPQTGEKYYGYLSLSSEKKKFSFTGPDGAAEYGVITADNGYTFYFTRGGSFLTGFQTYKNKRYYFDTETGVARRGWFMVDNDRYYAAENTCALATGLRVIDGATYGFYDTGARADDRFMQINGKTYYFDSYGQAVSGLREIDGKIFIFDARDHAALDGFTEYEGAYYLLDSVNGAFTNGFATVDNRVLYFLDDGSMARGLTKKDDKIYFFRWEDGAQQTGLVQVGVSDYMYLNADGTCLTGLFRSVAGETYWFDEETKLARSGLVETDQFRYYFDPDTKQAVYGFVQSDAYNPKPCYFTSDGSKFQGFLKENDDLYYIGANGRWTSGTMRIDGTLYCFDKNTGKAITGFYTTASGSVYYFDGANGALTGLRQINGAHYYFSSDGILQKGNFRLDGVLYRSDSVTGEILTGLGTSSSGYRYYFDGVNGSVTGIRNVNGRLYSFGSSGNMNGGRLQVGDNYQVFDPYTGVDPQAIGFVRYGNKIFYQNGESGLVTGFQQIGDRCYYFDQNGQLRGGFFKTPEGYYLVCDENTGAIKTGLWEDNSHYLREFTENGIVTEAGIRIIDGAEYNFYSGGAAWAMETAWQSAEKRWYCFDSVIRANTPGIYPDKNGVSWFFVNGEKHDLFAAPGEGFYTTEGVTFWFDADGSFATGFREINGDTYYFAQGGAMQTGIRVIENRKYYFGRDGKMQTGVVYLEGKRFYFDETTGAMTTGPVRIGRELQWFSSDGLSQQGWAAGLNGIYYIGENDRVMTGFFTADGKEWYASPETGELAMGLTEIDGAEYYFDLRGERLHGLYFIDSVPYYFDPIDGKREFGIIQYEDGVYFLTPNGFVTGLVTVDGKEYYFSTVTGKMQTGARVVDSVKCFFSEQTGERLYGFQYVAGETYYYTPNGVLTGKQTIGGSEYSFTSSGILNKGLVWSNGLVYYYNEKTGERETGRCPVGDSIRYLLPDGTCWYGLMETAVGTYYYDTVYGNEIHGLQSIENHVYYFAQDGRMAKNEYFEIEGVHYYADPNGYVSVFITSTSTSIERMIAETFPYVGMEYSFDLTQGVDCSGLVMHALEPFALNPKRFAYKQWNDFKGRHIKVLTDMDELKPGDLIYSSRLNCVPNLEDTEAEVQPDEACHFWNEVHHVSIYLGDGKVIEPRSTLNATVVNPLSVSRFNYICLMVRVVDDNTPFLGATQ